MNTVKKTLKVEFTKGNKKLPMSTYILNVGSATNCPSVALGLCDVADVCYALKAERLYKGPLPYRERQRVVFDTVSGLEIAQAMLDASNHPRTIYKMKEFRYSEAGDFNGQCDVNKMVTICKRLKREGVICYGYTARTDLDLTKLIEVSSVNVSNDLGSWIDKGANRFRAVGDSSIGNNPCFGDCRKCSLCFTLKGAEILVDIH